VKLLIEIFGLAGALTSSLQEYNLLTHDPLEMWECNTTAKGLFSFN